MNYNATDIRRPTQPVIEPQRATSTKPMLLSKRELSALLRKSPRTIELWVRAGYISCIKVGRSVLFEREQVLTDLRRFRLNAR